MALLGRSAPSGFPGELASPADLPSLLVLPEDMQRDAQARRRSQRILPQVQDPKTGKWIYDYKPDLPPKFPAKSNHDGPLTEAQKAAHHIRRTKPNIAVVYSVNFCHVLEISVYNHIILYPSRTFCNIHAPTNLGI